MTFDSQKLLWNGYMTMQESRRAASELASIHVERAGDFTLALDATILEFMRGTFGATAPPERAS